VQPHAALVSRALRDHRQLSRPHVAGHAFGGEPVNAGAQVFLARRQGVAGRFIVARAPFHFARKR
jgi:hypothetical protein